MRRRLHRLAFSFALALIFFGQASALLSPLGSSTDTFYRRQTQGGLQTLTTTQIIETNAGPATQTCTTTFTPITGPWGEPLVKVVRKCTIVAGATSQSTSLTSSSVSTTSSAQSTSTTTSLSSSVSPAIIFSSFSVSPPTSSAPSSTSLAASASAVSSSNPPSSTSPAPASATTTNNGATAASAADSSASASNSAQAAFQIPGKKISVLPIGLGIFAGISVIALIVVGLVTYERTKYRKIFRQRKLAEQGQGTGYGGLP